ncbi:MAG TPA: lysylphosphatidylglycerol synthase domain-containing protein [Polyangia bacterium]|jgi:putative membrane protein|nr:lysylphosphatidylglycerol synthase domain-containing protein [Polyangia bacterium]
MRFLLLAGSALGVALLLALGWAFHGPTLTGALEIGLLPVVCASAYRPFSLALYAWSWRLLIPAPGRPRFSTLWRLRWIGEAINGLLPAAQIGGDLTRARLLAARGTGGADAGAAMVADVALGAFTQALFGISGLAALVALGAGARGRLGEMVAVGSLITLVAGVALLGLLHAGAGQLLARLPIARRLGARGKALTGGVASLDAAMKALAHRRRALATAALWHFLGWLSHVVETWGVLALCGARVSFRAALAIESLSAAARAAAFFIPGGLGVQEGAVVYLCRHLGVAPEPALALGLVKRMREIAVGLPGLVAWAIAERAPLGRLRTRLLARWSRGCADA